jgi:hypothetical protein
MNGAVARVADCRATAVDTIRRDAVQALASAPAAGFSGKKDPA